MTLTNYTPVDDIIHELGKRVKEYRIAENLTQKEFALKAGITPSTLTRMERGEIRSIESFIRVLKVLGFADRLDILLPEAEQRPSQTMKGQKQRQRVRKIRMDTADWKWGDET